jgi:hypothetical protein
MVYCSEDLSSKYRPLKLLLLLVSFAPSYLFVWKKAVLSPVLTAAKFSIINCAAVAWLIMLIAMQIIWVLLELLLLAFSDGMPDQD